MELSTMKTTVFSNTDDLDLPQSIKDSLTDKLELAHIRKLEKDTYIILNYPTTDHSMRSLVCTLRGGDNFHLYLPVGPAFEFDVQDSFPHLVLAILKRYETLIHEVRDQLNIYEKELEVLISRTHVIELYLISKELIHYQTAVNALGDVVQFIRREKPNSLWNEEQIFDYASIKIEINQLNQNIDMNQEILKSMIDVSESLYSNKLNKTMKSLTSITLIISIPMMITSFYGMNIQLPFQDHPYALIIVFLISFLLTLIPVMYFYKKDLF